MNFDRCAILASFHRPQDALRRRCPLAVPKIAYRLGAPSDFDRCAISPSLYPPPAAVGFNAQNICATKLRYASICVCSVSQQPDNYITTFGFCQGKMGEYP